MNLINFVHSNLAVLMGRTGHGQPTRAPTRPARRLSTVGLSARTHGTGGVPGVGTTGQRIPRSATCCSI
jgi:hypothetical protein